MFESPTDLNNKAFFDRILARLNFEKHYIESGKVTVKDLKEFCDSIISKLDESNDWRLIEILREVITQSGRRENQKNKGLGRRDLNHLFNLARLKCDFNRSKFTKVKSSIVNFLLPEEDVVVYDHELPYFRFKHGLNKSSSMIYASPRTRINV